MQKYNVVISVAVFRFNEKDPLSFSVGLNRNFDNQLVLPSVFWCDASTIEVTAKYLLQEVVYVDTNWLDVEEVGVVEVMEELPYVMCLWRSYVVDTLETNQDIEWVEYAKLESIGGRLVRDHLKALRRAFNR